MSIWTHVIILDEDNIRSEIDDTYPFSGSTLVYLGRVNVMICILASDLR